MMKKFVITFAASGNIIVEAETEEDAIQEFEDMNCNPLIHELTQNGIEMTDIQEEQN